MTSFLTTDEQNAVRIAARLFNYCLPEDSEDMSDDEYAARADEFCYHCPFAGICNHHDHMQYACSVWEAAMGDEL